MNRYPTNTLPIWMRPNLTHVTDPVVRLILVLTGRFPDADDLAAYTAALAQTLGAQARVRIGFRDGVPYTVWTEVKS